MQCNLSEAGESLALREKDVKELADQLSQQNDELLKARNELLMKSENIRQAELTVQTLQQTIVELQASEVHHAYVFYCFNFFVIT